MSWILTSVEQVRDMALCCALSLSNHNETNLDSIQRLAAPVVCDERLRLCKLIHAVMIPFYVRMIPLFILYRTFGWLDTLLPLIVPAFFAGNAFFIFLLRQFFLTINRELEDAARIDGCSTFGVYWRIILPLSKPALAVIAVFDFVFNWNDFLGPLIFLNSNRNRTVAVGLAYFQGSMETAPMTHLLMAAALVSIIPVLVLFFFTQRHFIQGIVFTGMKG